MIDENYANAPISLAERRAEREDDCRLLPPRDLLVQLLRAIDVGEIEPSGMVVIWQAKRGDATQTCLRRSKSTTIEAVGMIETAKIDLLLATTIG